MPSCSRTGPGGIATTITRRQWCRPIGPRRQLSRRSRESSDSSRDTASLVQRSPSSWWMRRAVRVRRRPDSCRCSRGLRRPGSRPRSAARPARGVLTQGGAHVPSGEGAPGAIAGVGCSCGERAAPVTRARPSRCAPGRRVVRPPRPEPGGSGEALTPQLLRVTHHRRRDRRFLQRVPVRARTDVPARVRVRCGVVPVIAIRDVLGTGAPQVVVTRAAILVRVVELVPQTPPTPRITRPPA